MLDDLLTQGQAALKAGDKSRARQLLQSAVQQNPQNETAWLWLAGATDVNFERALYLERALEINPGNVPARHELDKVRTAMLDASPAPVVARPPVPATPAANRVQDAKGKRKPKKLTAGKVVYWVIFSTLVLIAGFLVIVWIIEGGIPALFQKNEPVAPALYTVTYEITGSAISAKIEYSTGGYDSMQGNSLLPFEKQIDIKTGDLAFISAENNGESGSVICRIWANGKVWKESRKAGAFAKVECRGLVKTGYDWPP